MYFPVLISANPPEADALSETLVSSVTIIDFCNRPWVPASLLNVGKESIFLDRHELGEIAITTIEFMVSQDEGIETELVDGVTNLFTTVVREV